MPTIDFSNTIAGWQQLVRPRASDLEDTRLQLHWAAQIVAALGTSSRPPQADDSHTNLEWSQAHGGLISRGPAGPRQISALLRFDPPVIEILRTEGQDERTEAMLKIVGQRFYEVFARFEAHVQRKLGQPNLVLERPRHELPSHPVDPDGEAAPFATFDDLALAELTRWYANGDRALRELAAQDPRATPVRCWPHHFDIATLLVIARADPDDPTSEVSSSIGVGMTPGDGSYADAYWYVTPWPYPAAPTLPPLAGGGIWHTDGWVGAVLTSTALRNPQAENFAAFMRSALAACEAMVA